MSFLLAAWWILLSVAFMFALRYGLLFEFLLRLRVEPGRAITLPREKIPRALRQLLDLAAPRLEALGFSRSVSLAIWGAAVTVRNRPTFTDTYYSASSRCHAWVSLADDPERGVPYVVDFQTCYADGCSLLTMQRRFLALPALPPEISTHDECADDLEECCQVHMVRQGNNSSAEISDDPAEAWRRFQGQLASHQLFLEEQGLLRSTRQPGQRRLSMRGAAQLLMRFAPGLRRIMRVRPVSRRVDVSRRMRALADGVAFSRSLTASTVVAHDWLIKMLMVSGGALFGAQAWGVQGSWQTVPGVIVVLTVHELCHFAATHLSGYREGDTYCVPILGAAANVHNDVATVWQRLFVYLAAPLCGIVLGVLCIDAAANVNGALRSWLLPFGAVALGVNLLNLLPFPPLDGGKLVESLAWWRWPYLRPALVAIGALSLLATGAYLQAPVALGLGTIFAFAFPAERRISEFAAAARKAGGVLSERKRALPAVFRALARSRRGAALDFPGRVEVAKAVLPLVMRQAPRPAHAAAGWVIYALALAAPVATYLAL